MNINHELLCAVGVSCKELERLVHAARKAGAYGAKLTGAGGGGCMIALAPPEKVEEVADAIQRARGEPIITRKTDVGVLIEE
jgi:mevalonate kinase